MQTRKSRTTGKARSNDSNDTAIDRVLHHLDQVKSIGTGKWQALCPAHDDRRPSLSIKATNDGTVLLKCWAGCGAAEIVSALGLSLGDLFPGDRRNLQDYGTGGPTRRSFDYQDALTGIAHEVTVARLIVEAVNRGDEVDTDTLDRLALAETRISDALSAAGGAQ
ncbi:virulence-associated protein E [Acidithiobacillus ferrivorans]|nr:virulence-associated protein E [Acidithiobacillus ferrivorans]